MSHSRSFSLRQRRALYRAAGGKCEECGRELKKGWHADHVVPHSKGGATTIENGQALCPSCNLSKSDQHPMDQDPFQESIFGPTPYEQPLEWQRKAIERFFSVDSPFLADATPGSGKTAFAAYLFRMGFGHEWERIFVITNSQQRRQGWVEDLHEFGIDVMENWGGRTETPTLKDYYGGVSTYQILPGNEQDLRALTNRPTLVVFDEIHHLGDEMRWGRSAYDAFGHQNVQTVGLTGTPFRSDNVRIPFVPYERDGEQLVSNGHVGYTYGDALRDGVLRYVNFITYDGQIEWHGHDGQIHEASFGDDVSDQEERGRLRAAVSSKEWVLPQIREADQKLTEIRNDRTPNAGGFVVARSKSHARQICQWMRGDLGRDPLLVESDIPKAHQRIKDFKSSSRRWIVAIQMVSEGVNIERLRVGVYASNVTAPLFLYQVIGRVRRGPDGQSWFWFPADPRIVEVLEEIREMRDHVIEDTAGGGDGGEREAPSLFMTINAELGGFEMLGPLFDEIESMGWESLDQLPKEVLIAYIQARGDLDRAGPGGDGASATEKPKYEKEQELGREVNKIAARVAARRFPDAFNEGGEEKGIAISRVHGSANDRVGIDSREEATVSDLEEKKQVLLNMLEA